MPVCLVLLPPACRTVNYPRVSTHHSLNAASGIQWATIALLSLGIGTAWLLVVFSPPGMDAGPAAFLAGWTVMMTAMMLPSAAPLILLYRLGASPAATLTLVAGYLLVWAAVGVAAYSAELLPMSAAPVALATAGVYQLTAFKQACLRRCRSPADFLVQRWGHGALRLGLEHGLWCLGCCWALMVVLVLAGSMGLAWVVGIAAIVAVEKLTPHGVLWSRLTGIALIVTALIHGGMAWTGN